MDESKNTHVFVQNLPLDMTETEFVVSNFTFEQFFGSVAKK